MATGPAIFPPVLDRDAPTDVRASDVTYFARPLPPDPDPVHGTDGDAYRQWAAEHANDAEFSELYLDRAASIVRNLVCRPCSDLFLKRLEEAQNPRIPVPADPLTDRPRFKLPDTPRALEETKLNTLIEDFVDGYEVRSDEGDYTPNEHERFLITDAIYGLIDDEEFVAELRPVPALPSAEALAGKLYARYCDAVGGIAFNGDPLPAWAVFRADPSKTKQSDAWLATAETAIALLPH